MVATVVVTYNRLSYLKNLIESLRQQTYTDNHIIVINNSSTDGTAEWLAVGPGTDSTFTPCAWQSATKSSPGSEIAGIPASVTNAQFSPPSSRAKIISPRSRRLCS